MSGFNLRKRARVCYYEPEEPPFDEFVFCSECQDYVYEYCSIHGPLLVIPDDKGRGPDADRRLRQVAAETGLPAFVPRAALSVPSVFLHIAYSYIPEAGLGVFSTLTLPVGVRFGPYRGQRVNSAGDSTYGWQIYDRDHKPLHIVDARDANNSNWMRYVNCARHHAEQNLVAFQYQGELYYRTVRIVPRFTELLVFYGSEFAAWLGVDLRAYNKPCPCPHCQARLVNKNEPKKTKKRQARVQEEKENNTKKKTAKYSPVEKLQETSTSPQVESPMNTNIQEVVLQPVVNTTTGKTDLNATNFKCDQCGKDYDMKSDLEKHIQTHELLKQCVNQRASKDFTCKECSCTFETKLLLLQHAKSKHAVEYFACTECEYTTYNKGNLKRHLRKHTGEKPYKCNHCSKAFTESGNLQTHLRTHSGEKPYKCNQCSSAFTNSGNLQTHLRTHTGEKPYKCNQCSKAFTESGNLQTHLRTHSGEKPYKCNQCSSAFTNSGNLQTHLRTHTGEKPYKCNQCSSAFTKSGDLKTHLRTHTGEKPYKCNQCSSAFTQSGALKTHLRTHTGEKPYKCNQCSSAFTVSCALKTHLRAHTGEKPFECNICEYKTTQSSNLKAHLMSVHSGQKPFGCSICSYRGATRQHVSLHMKRHHKQA